MKEILPGIYTWHEFSEEKQLNFNGYFLVSRGESVLIDPPRMIDNDITELENLAGKNSENSIYSSQNSLKCPLNDPSSELRRMCVAVCMRCCAKLL